MTCRSMVIAAIVMLACAPAHAQSSSRGAGGPVIWTAVGAGAGFGVGLWAGEPTTLGRLNLEPLQWRDVLRLTPTGAR